MKKKIWKNLLSGIVLGSVALCLFLALFLAVDNQHLPARSPLTEQLSTLDKAHLSEAVHLRQTLGKNVWPGWADQKIPLMVYNENAVFLVGLPAPAAGWVKVPQNQARGGVWTEMPQDDFEGQPYWRQPLPGENLTPENFTVRVGDTWVATMETQEYMEVNFYAGLRKDIPSFLQPLLPYRVFWGLLMGNSEKYIGGLEHESFHAFQGHLAPERLAEAERSNQNERAYPWEDQAFLEQWQNEMAVLVKAARAPGEEECAALARRFLEQRDERRSAANLAPELVAYERQREWLEGLAKYAELAILREAGQTPNYAAVEGMSADANFHRYAYMGQYTSSQIDEALRTAGREGETRFYYSGMVQALVLDRLLPGWKEKAFLPGVMVEDLLRQAVQ